MKKYIIYCGLCLISCSCLSGCLGILNEEVGVSAAEVEINSETVAEGLYEITDADSNIDCENPINIDLNQQEGDNNYYVWENHCLTITKAGDFLISGTMVDGQIIVNVFDDEIVHLIFNGVELTSTQGPALYVEEAGKVIITLAEGTESVVSDSARYQGTSEACIFSNVDLTVNGRGSLYVYGYYHDALRSKDCIKVVDTTLYVQAKNNGIRGNDGVVIINSKTDIECEGIGIKSGSDKGFVVLQGGKCKIIAGENAVSSENCVMINGCDTDLYSVKETISCKGDTIIYGEE